MSETFSCTPPTHSVKSSAEAEGRTFCSQEMRFFYPAHTPKQFHEGEGRASARSFVRFAALGLV